jgi:SAM-dependent methyltransferase
VTGGLVDAVRAYYEGRLGEHGLTPQGVDWRDEASQRLRFRQLCRLFEGQPLASLLDYGCGYGALVPFLRANGHRGQYVGVDVSPVMVEAARTTTSDTSARFEVLVDFDGGGDFVVSSGLFNVRLDFPLSVWEDYVFQTIGELARRAGQGFAFNCLTSYSDPDRMRPDLYYADPSRMFDYCKRNYSQNVALLHDYGLYEFTILVRKHLPKDEVRGETLSR